MEKKITAIEIQKNNRERVNVFINGEYLFSIPVDFVYRYSLEAGKTVDEELLTELLKSDDFEKAKNKALNSLSRAQCSEKNMRRKLSGEYNEEIIEMVISFLKKYNFIDDERFAERIVESNMNCKKLGKNRIRQKLYSKGIERSDIEDAVSGIDDDAELENAIYLGRKKLSKIKDKDRRVVRNKLYKHLAYKGFGYDTINSAIGALEEEFE